MTKGGIGRVMTGKGLEAGQGQWPIGPMERWVGTGVSRGERRVMVR